jgi:hypothetical protein
MTVIGLGQNGPVTTIVTQTGRLVASVLPGGVERILANACGHVP